MNNGDFKKRIKAKVGKRAPKPLNVTDTQFKATKIKIQDQSTSIHPKTTTTTTTTNSKNNTYNDKQRRELCSSRGRSIRELILQLQHPASSVRISASKGLKDIVSIASTTRRNTNNYPQKLEISDSNEITENDELYFIQGETIRQHLSILLPACAKCWLDEDRTVRDIGGISTLNEILSYFSSSTGGRTGSKLSMNDHDNSKSNRSSLLLVPFVPLLIAYVTASLNSMNRSICRTGSTVVYVLSTCVPEIVMPYVPTLLQSMIRLVSSMSSVGATSLSATGTGSTNGTNAVKNTAISTNSNNVGSMKSNNSNRKRKRKQNMTTIHKDNNSYQQQLQSSYATDATKSETPEATLKADGATILPKKNSDTSNRSSTNHSTINVVDVDLSQISIVQSVAALLQTMECSKLKSTTTTSFSSSIVNVNCSDLVAEPDSIFTNDSNVCNGIMLFRQQQQQFTNYPKIDCTKIQTILKELYDEINIDYDENETKDLCDNNNKSTNIGHNNATLIQRLTSIRTNVDSKTIYDVLVHVRDVFVEVAQQNNIQKNNTTMSGLYVNNTNDSEKFLYGSRIIRYLVQYFITDLHYYCATVSTTSVNATAATNHLSSSSLSSSLSSSYSNKKTKRKQSLSSFPTNRLHKLLYQIGDLLLEYFPLITYNTNNNKQATFGSIIVDEINANLCLSLQCMASILNDIQSVPTTTTTTTPSSSISPSKTDRKNATTTSSSSNSSIRETWLETIALYVQQSLEIVEDDDEEEMEDCMDISSPTICNPTTNSTFDISKSLLVVFENFIFFSSNVTNWKTNKYYDDPTSIIYTNLIDTFCSVFFKSMQLPQQHHRAQTRALSDTGRYAFRIAVSMYETCMYNVERVYEYYYGGTSATNNVLSLSSSLSSAATSVGGIEPPVYDSIRTIINIPKVLLTQYLMYWNPNDHLREITMTLVFIENIVRYYCHDNDNNNNNVLQTSLLNTFRVGMESLVDARFNDNNDDDNNNHDNHQQPKTFQTTSVDSYSIFEAVPPSIQRRIVCLIVLLEYPTETTLLHLGRICSRCRLRNYYSMNNKTKKSNIKTTSTSLPTTIISESEATYVVQTIRTIRRTIPMQKYFGFLLDCTGLMKLHSLLLSSTSTSANYNSNNIVVNNNNNDYVITLMSDIDNGLRDVCSCFIECNIVKVLPKLEPVLKLFLQQSNSSSSNSDKSIIISRAAIAMLAMFSLDLQKDNPNSNSEMFVNVSAVMESTTTRSIMKLCGAVVSLCIVEILLYSTIHATTTTSGSRMALSSILTRPAKVLLCLEQDDLLLNVMLSLIDKLELGTTGSAGTDDGGRGVDQDSLHKSSSISGCSVPKQIVLQVLLQIIKDIDINAIERMAHSDCTTIDNSSTGTWNSGSCDTKKDLFDMKQLLNKIERKFNNGPLEGLASQVIGEFELFLGKKMLQ